MLNQNVNNRDLEMGSHRNKRKSMNNQFDELTKSLALAVRHRAALKQLGVGRAGRALAITLLTSVSALVFATNARAQQATATISGKVLEDLTGNGISADDASISGRTIRLYRDNGDLLFNAATDTLVKTDTTR